jgi:hypothetical protein
MIYQHAQHWQKNIYQRHDTTCAQLRLNAYKEIGTKLEKDNCHEIVLSVIKIK